MSVNTIIRYDNEVRKITAVGEKQFTLDNSFSNSSSFTNKIVSVVTGVAYGQYSHSEGVLSTAVGDYSHAEGDSSIASGQASHASGILSQANSKASFAAGARVIADHQEGEVALGRNNISSSDTIMSVGIGSIGNADVKRNAMDVKTNGDVYIKDVGGYDGTTTSNKKTLQEVLTDMDSNAIVSITTNGVPLAIINKTVDIPLHEYVRIDELQEHTHNLWEIPGAEAAATNAINAINAAQDLSEVKAAMIQFLNNFKKPTP